MRALAASLALAALLAADAAAQTPSPDAGKSVMVVPFTGDGSDAERQRFTEAAARGIRKSGARVDMAKTSATDLVAINGCVMTDTECMTTIPGALGVDVVVFGKVSGSGDKRTVIIVRVSSSGIERTTASAGDVEPESAKLFGATDDARGGDGDGSGDSKGGDGVGGDSGDKGGDGGIHEGDSGDLGGGSDLSGPPDNGGGVAAAGPYGTRDGGDFDFGRVERYSWYIAAGGAGAVAVGGLLLILGNATQSDIDSAPTDSVADLDRLEDLEGRARILYGFGNTLAITGLVAVAVGGGLIFYQAGRGDSAEASPETTVGVAPVRGGAVLTIGGRR